MGRRKIEIQPITHERNRSVTFLKRKNGLFKKAYELGVLCSVDVAVIIFEARPGHEVKLHEYSSTDIRGIVQRQTRHQGETDLKVPADFSGSASKFDDAGDGDGDDDNADEEEDLPVAKSSRRTGQARLTLSTNADNYSVPPPPPAHLLHPDQGSGASLSVANDRVSNMRDLHPPRSNKRARNARSRSPSEDAMMPALPTMNSEWDDHGLGRYGRNIRHPHNPPHAPPPGLSQQDHQHQQYHSMHQQQHTGHGFQYTPLFPVSNQVSPPPAFIPLHQDFGPSRGLPPFSSRPGGSSGTEGYVDLHQRMRPSESSGYEHAPYPPNANPMPRHSEHHHQHLLSPPPPPPATTVPHRREDRGTDGAFGSSLLGADERSRQRSGNGGGLDWPMHDGLALSGRSGGTGPTGSRSLDGPGISNQPNGGSDSWFEYLSRPNDMNQASNNGRRSSASSTWPPRDVDTTRHDKSGEDNQFDGGRKESAVRGESVVGGGHEARTLIGQTDVVDLDISPTQLEKTGEGDILPSGQDIEDARSDEDKKKT